MTTTFPYTLFPELHDLRKTLNEYQSHYAAHKPLLDAAIEALVPRVRMAPIAEIGRAMRVHRNEIPNELIVCYQKTHAALAELDKSLADPKRIHEYLEAGKGVEIVAAIKTPLLFLFEMAGKWNGDIQGMKVRMEHDAAMKAYRSIIDLVVVLSNATFEALDSFPAAIRKGSEFESFFAAIQPSAISMTALPEFEPFWKVWEYWEARWRKRAGQANAIHDWLQVATVQARPLRNVRQLQTGDALTDLLLYKDKLRRAAISRGRLPAGMELNPQGQIVVSNPSALVPGYYEGLEISGITTGGRAFTCVVPEIIVAPYVEIAYQLSPRIPMTEMRQGYVLAFPSGPQGSVIEAQITGGNFPPGIRFNTQSGVISVGEPLNFVAGTYEFEVTTSDKNSLETQHRITLEFFAPEMVNLQDGKGDQTGRLIVDSLKVLVPDTEQGPDALSVVLLEAQLPLSPDQLIGVVTAEGMKIESWRLVEGSFPLGTKLDVGGELVAFEVMIDLPSRYFATLMAKASNGATYQIELEVRFLGEKESLTVEENSTISNSEMAGEMDIAIPPFSISQRTGKIIANLAPKGTSFVDTEVEKGALPAGLVLLENGTIKVAAPKSLVPGRYDWSVLATDTDGKRYRLYLNTEITR